ncbi:MAG: acetolactate synthase large subunit [Paracoccaceae bacterium]|uniref:acetolactate synthase large subunit n=1 Tax=unclassified Seohaeicola TaxID=2641111 RepID=UPI00237BEE1D|nr:MULTISPECIES: acetolactate synthase large subunit [unclassified Seohaeicola]MDD9708807.1 acetolactate synthase large subunit [Seohaeicola sp. 4SK31]MDD9736966.1 acetolactate synthase large subunit [Seohaeicola sp. SP36]MDF1707301.1 acetolactate synthase large subunit [Paracoccaceae bacterium]MDM7970200.1 acetolactate synthase large subunit [Paracoccaceae bacterium]
MTDKTNPAMNGAESLVHTLLASGVDTCFSNPGTSEMHFVAALDHIPGMRSVLTLQEGVATGAADGYYRMAGKTACTLLHLGPGLANGLSNLHNAKKAGSGVLNIIGEHAESHIALDAPLTSDIQGIARPVSHWVHTSKDAASLGHDAAQAVQAANTAPGQVAALILPSDTAWTEGGVVADPLPATPRPDFDRDQLEAAIAALSGPDSLLLLGGAALTEANLDLAGRISAATGCALLSEWANARMDRGAGRVSVARVPYPIDIALKVLAPYKRIVLVGARAPIGFFAYPGKPAILTAEGAQIITLADTGADLAAALTALCDGAGAAETAPAHVAQASVPDRPNGPLDPDNIALILGRAIPQDAVIVDESVTTGRGFFKATQGAPRHVWLNNCGGSIGYGLPVAIGAAIAAPDRKIMALTGDGSAMYTLQALWTMARENLDITVVIFANRSYRILRGELTNVGVGNPGPRAIDMLSLDRPNLDWVQMSRGMGVEAEAVTDCAGLEAALEAGLASSGPYLIEAIF